MPKTSLSLIPTDQPFQLLRASFGGNGLGEYRDITDLTLPEGVDWTKGIVLDNTKPLWLTAWLTTQCTKAPWLAIVDVRHGAVVVRSHVGSPAVGEAIPLDVILPYSRGSEVPCRVIAFVGPPN